MLKLSIVIVSYNTKNILLDCINSINQSDIDKSILEIIIVDNGSNDGTLELIQELKKNIKIKLIKNERNIGFGAANNKGIRQALGEYILLLNSDILLEKDTLSKQLRFAQENPIYVASTCKLILSNNKIDPACHRGFPTVWASLTYFSKLEKLLPKTKLFGQYHQGWKNLEAVHEVDAISGAFFWIKKEILQQVGLFDEGFFMYGEDLDLCLRLRQKKYKIAFYPQNTALHLKGKSGRNKIEVENLDNTSKAINYHFYNAMWLFYQKHYLRKYPKIINYLVKKLVTWKSKQYE